MATDRELIEKVQNGEREVYGQLFQRYYAQIYAICLAMLGNPQDAEELAQDVFVLAYLRLDQLREPEKFFPWLKKITRNQSKNRMQKVGPRLVPLDLASSRTTPDAPDERILRQELMDSIMEAIEALPARDREVVQARIDGLNHTEISQRFGISVQASMSRLSRSRQRLADHMKGLLSVIVGLPKILPLKKLISGGIIAMKIGTGAKVTIGIIGIIMAGIMGFLISTHQLDSTKTGEGQIAATTEQATANAAGNTLDASSNQQSDQQNASDGDETEAWNALMGALDEMEESAHTETEDAQPETSETAQLETENDKAAISPELAESFTIFDQYESQIRALDEEYMDVNTEFSTLQRRYIEIGMSLNDVVDKEEREELRAESQQIYKRMQDLKPMTHQYGEQRSPLFEERDDIFRQKYGMSAHRFISKFSEEYKVWRASL